ncbi:hypothetical protein [Bacillus toyonensis]|uniref:hypothetical protein n=1 Tax=Bacillus toyonensis TaxID=155322 RepID=UPI002E1FC79B|nr:hypothetical protein [Bacillus toyonensis]
MKKTLTIKKVKTMEELVDRYDYRSEYLAAYVEELSAYAIAVAYEASHSCFVGHSAIKSGGALKNVLVRGDNANKVHYSIYVVYESKVEIYSLSGNVFDLFGSCNIFDFNNETVDSVYIEDEVLYEAERFVQSQVASCAL